MMVDNGDQDRSLEGNPKSFMIIQREKCCMHATDAPFFSRGPV